MHCFSLFLSHIPSKGLLDFHRALYWCTGQMHCGCSVFVGNGCSKRSIIPFSDGRHYAGDVPLACSSRCVWNNANGTNSTLPLYCSECCGHFLLPCLRTALLSNCHTYKLIKTKDWGFAGRERQEMSGQLMETNCVQNKAAFTLIVSEVSVGD